MMLLRLGAPLSVRSVSDLSPAASKFATARSFSASPPLSRRTRCFRQSLKSAPFSCKSIHRSSPTADGGPDYLQASVLDSETVRHYQMRRQGLGFAVESRAEANSIGFEFLRRFQTPTIFLKISCDGDFLLPISVGEFAVESLIETLRGNLNGVISYCRLEYIGSDYVLISPVLYVDLLQGCPNQFQFMRQLLGELGHQVEMVKITERVVNTYIARIYFSKPGEKDIFMVDARPSDAIIIAKICGAPTYVNKQIVLTDAIEIVYRLGRANGRKTVYDVTLDSATDGPDLLAEELDLLRNIKFAVEEERYKDAAIWRDRLMMLRKSTDGQ